MARSEEHTYEIQSLMRNSYAVFCFKRNGTPYNDTYRDPLSPSDAMPLAAAAAISGVSSGGLDSTALPATRAAATWPVKIASGKFQGEMHTTGPKGSCAGPKVDRACAA